VLVLDFTGEPKIRYNFFSGFWNLFEAPCSMEGIRIRKKVVRCKKLKEVTPAYEQVSRSITMYAFYATPVKIMLVV